jgi:hypothetical protein
MPVKYKYAEITIVINLETESILNYFKRLLGNENSANDNDTIIILFDDETVYNVKHAYIDKKFTFGPQINIQLPLYFDKTDTKDTKDYSYTFYYKVPRIDNGVKKLNFKYIFLNNPIYCTFKKEESVYNLIYYKINTLNDVNDVNDENAVFSIIKSCKNTDTPRYLLAYDDTYFKKDEIIYLVNCIFKNNFI